MPTLITRDNTTGALNIDIELKNEEGKLTIGSDLSSGSLPVSFWDGTTFVALQRCDSAVELTSTNNMELIDGPGIYRFAKPANVSFIAYIGTESNATIIEVS